MTLELGVLIIICCMISVSEYILTKKIFTASTILAWPYVFIILINSLFGEKLRFYLINISTIEEITIGIICFWVGSLVALAIKKCIKFKKIVIKKQLILEDEYHINKIARFTTVIASVNFIRLFYYFYKFGINNFIANDGMNSILMTGILCHFLLATYPLTGILMSYYLSNKKIKYLIPVVMVMILAYFTFTKYHLISLVLIIIIYINIENPKMLLKTLPIFISLPILIFFANYIMNFNARGISANEGYLLNHLINYLSGGILYDSLNPNFTYNNYGLAELVLLCFMALPNVFTRFLFGSTYYMFEQIPFLYMGSNGERGNVINTISFFFSSDNMIGTCLFICILGFVVSSISVNSFKNFPLISVVYTFTFLSFYATFLVLTPPWEMIIFSIIIPKLFIKKSYMLGEQNNL